MKPTKPSKKVKDVKQCRRELISLRNTWKNWLDKGMPAQQKMTAEELKRRIDLLTAMIQHTGD